MGWFSVHSLALPSLLYFICRTIKKLTVLGGQKIDTWVQSGMCQLRVPQSCRKEEEFKENF